MVLYATFNNISAISWQSALLVEETGVSGENHRPCDEWTERTKTIYLTQKGETEKETTETVHTQR
jgi:hypothetical protein